MQPFAELPTPLGEALNAVSDLGRQAGLLFPADVLAIWRGWLHLVPAGESVMVRARRFDASDAETLAAAVPADARPATKAADIVLIVCPVPWRLMVTHGPRGYRNSLLEAGVLVAQMGSLLSRAGLLTEVVVDFVDTAVERLLDLDGVEKFPVALITAARAGGGEG